MRKLTNAFYKIYTGFSVITGELPTYFYMNNAIRFLHSEICPFV
jgi:hypothetical protein